MESVVLKNVRKQYGKNKILTDVSFSVNDGDVLCIAGANGCGKSTLLSIIAGVLKADKGQIIANNVGYVPQDNPLIEELTVRDNLMFWYAGTHFKIDDDCKPGGILFELEIVDFIDKKVKNLSGGMKKRVSIACACAKRPSVLIMDEPGAFLDLSGKKMVRDFIKDFSLQGKTVIFASHEEEEILIANKMAVIKNQKLTMLETVVTKNKLLELI